ncbi:hypothetical protein GXM_04333 [Nostoc sphaeroides CCNUC1]|uniref:Uncharacterized protein n=1 Tax=Nostoc sphaeroides CCNUC1 TaxID=2653204 RepID=A0A5P8W2G9_9NOSO|nr:hypothetical protein GXM_04333 [Nostoc sphaeroides CCNUC1]
MEATGHLFNWTLILHCKVKFGVGKSPKAGKPRARGKCQK